MKKSLLAFAVLGAFAGAASAQSSVSIYGVADAAITYTNNGNPAGKKLGLDSGQQSGSRVGFKGTEDLGGGLSAIFTLESGFAIDKGEQADDALFNRQAWVGLAGGFGAVKFGRQETALYSALVQIDPFRIGLTGSAQKAFGYGLYNVDPLARTNNTVSYTTANVGGFSGSVSYGFGEKEGDTSVNRNIGAGAQYVNGPLNVQFAYQKSNTAALSDAAEDVIGDTTANVRAAFIGATYDFGVAKAHLGYGDNKLQYVGGEMKNRNWLVGASAPVGAAGTVLASYVSNDFQDADNAQSDQYSLGYTHALSKRTNLYTSYSYVKNEDDVALRAAYANGDSVRLFNVGVRHQF